jgi:DNA-binding transcriptional LysR family regulator
LGSAFFVRATRLIRLTGEGRVYIEQCLRRAGTPQVQA